MATKLSPKARSLLDRIIRINHAGEFGAVRIYAGQFDVLKNTQTGPTIKHMKEQEEVHFSKFCELMPKYRARPTIMLPLWNIAGYALGAGTALMSKEAAMACTVAVETVISEHYNNQMRELYEEDPEAYESLISLLKRFRDEEMEHHDTGISEDAEKAIGYSPLTEVIKAGCKAAIFISERI